MATSIRSGTVTASAMLRRLSAYPRQNGLAVALREVGRLERSIFMLNWLRDANLRRRSGGGLNKMGYPGAPRAVDGSAMRPEAGTWRWCRTAIGRTACSTLDWTSP